MKKSFLTLFLSLIFLLVSCSGKNASDLADSIDTDSTDTTADTSDTNVSDIDTTDTGTHDNEISDTDTTDPENPDVENPDTETSDNEISDTETSDSDTSEADTPDSDISDSDTSDSDITDTDNSDTDTSDTDVSDSDTSDTEIPDNDSSDSDTPDSDSSDSDTPDADTSDSDTSDSDTSDSDTSDSDITDTDNSDTDSSDSDTSDSGTSDTADVFTEGPYEVITTDVASGTDGAPRDFRIYEPADISGSIPVIHFQHDFMYKLDYYDNMLSHIASHGFIVVSSKSDHAKVNGQSSITEAQKVVAFINWLKENIQSKVSVTADVENFGIAGHGRGGKVSSRVTNYNEMTMLKGFFGLDPVDAQSLSDPATVTEFTSEAISEEEQCLALGGTWSGFLSKSCKNVTIDSQEKCEILGGYYFNGSKCYNNRATLPSMFLGTEKGRSGSSACAPAGENSTDFYASYPSPSRHIIAAGVGHADMVDPEDLSSCGSTCSGCTGSGNAELNQQFSRYSGGLMTAFFNITLKGETQYEALLDDVSLHPFQTTLAEHK